jgi:transposase
MTMPPQDYDEIPEQTRTVARQAFPKGNLYLQLRDELGVIYEDAQFSGF